MTARQGLRAWAATAAALILAACSGSSGEGTALDAAPLAAECGTALPALGQVVYVSTLGKDFDGCGSTTSTACQTIQRGIAACRTSAAGCGVLVRHGLYPTAATIVLRDGASVYGSCRFDAEPDRHYRTTILAAPTQPGAPAISAVAIATPTVLRDLVVIGQDETAPGAPSLGLVASGSTGLSVVATVLSTGRGGDGADGSAAGPVGTAQNGADGSKGGAGGSSCAANAEPSTGTGGQGGTDQTSAIQLSLFSFDCVSADAGTDGQPAGGDPALNRAARGAKGPPGLWCNGRPHDYPSPGTEGKNGAAGTCGAATQPSPLSAGRFSGTTWIASQGDNGRPGGVGGGGGGGGSGGACVIETNDIDQGFPGGGGGAGGCGGGAGTAGQQGGASMPLVLVDSSLVFDAGLNALVPGPGGHGGRALNATAGGAGGSAGAGRTDGQRVQSGHYCPAVGAAGGPGGPGGHGSAGAAGHGGPSIGIALVGRSTAPVGIDAVYASQPGLPGAAGRGGSIFPGGGCSPDAGPDGAGGVAGLAAALFDYRSPPANFLGAGQQLAVGESRTSLNGKVRVVLDDQLRLCGQTNGLTSWCLPEAAPDGKQARMQTDGNLCLYPGNGKAPVCSGTPDHPGAYLAVQDDGHTVITDGSAIFWSRP